MGEKGHRVGKTSDESRWHGYKERSAHGGVRHQTLVGITAVNERTGKLDEGQVTDSKE